MLDDFGDTSSAERRRELFDEIDEDGSGAVDFEEFINVSRQLFHLGGHTTANQS